MKKQREKNVFDQMYYTRVHEDFDWWSPGRFKGDFTNMIQLETVSRDRELTNVQIGFFTETYKSEYLEKDVHLSIYCDSKISELEISYYANWRLENEFFYTYKYSIKDKTLTYTTNDPENAHKDFLYTIFLKDWFEANPNAGFSMDNLGEFTVVYGE